MRGAPNPFRASTSLRVNLPAAGLVELTVLDVNGRSVRQLARSWMPAGSHVIAWDGTDHDGHIVPSGVYLTKLRVGTESVTQRIVRIQ
jgi:flagellar hook assembly protein FlgD